MTRGQRRYCWLSDYWAELDEAGRDRLVKRLVLGYRVDAASGCHWWVKAQTRGGHGLISVDGRNARPYRLAWIIQRGSIPLNQLYRHGLDGNGKPCGAECVNVAHSRGLGFDWHNTQDRVNDQTHCKRGHPFTGDNLRVDTRGWRVCNTCQAGHRARYKARKALTA